MEIVVSGLKEIEDYQEKVRAGHTFTVEEVERVKSLTARVQEIKLKPNRATKKKRKPRKKRT